MNTAHLRSISGLTARVAGTPIAQDDSVRSEVENDVRYANISIIEGTGASGELGIGVVAARIAEIIGQIQDAVVPIGSLSGEVPV